MQRWYPVQIYPFPGFLSLALYIDNLKIEWLQLADLGELCFCRLDGLGCQHFGLPDYAWLYLAERTSLSSEES